MQLNIKEFIFDILEMSGKLGLRKSLGVPKLTLAAHMFYDLFNFLRTFVKITL